MNILITNDDGINAKGIKVLSKIMSSFGNVTVIAPKTHQSGMSAAVSLGLKQIAYKRLSPAEAAEKTWPYGSSGKEDGIAWSYLDATPASCVKFGLNTIFLDRFPDLIVSGINHGSNAASASVYSGTLGAAAEGALNGVPSIGVSLDSLDPDADFSIVEQYFPGILESILDTISTPDGKGGRVFDRYRCGIYYNVNFPDIPAGKLKGVRTGTQGIGRWIREFKSWDPALFAKYGITPEMLGQSSETSAEEGEELYVMTGTFVNDDSNGPQADHLLMEQGYASVVAHNIDNTDIEEVARLRSCGIEKDF